MQKDKKMKIKVVMYDGKYLYVNRLLHEEKTFTVSSKQIDTHTLEDLTLLKIYEPQFNFITE